MIEHIKMMQYPILTYYGTEAIQVTCFGISKRPCAKHCPVEVK